ncbi:MAG: hypothetical protein SangKO_059640 [Sandaracinaceae bacterium]
MAFFDGYFLDESYDTTRFCHARSRLLREAEKREGVIDAVMTALKAPFNSAQRKRMKAKDKAAALAEHIPHLARMRNSEWQKCSAPEIFAAGLFLSKAKAEEKAKVFCPVKREEDLRKPVRKWLAKQKLAAHDEVPMGQSRVDLAGHKLGSFFGGPEQIVAVELKNQLSQLKRGLDQMTNYSDYAHEVYLACTPALAASYLRGHFNAKDVGRWDPDALNRKLSKFGIGLLLVENGKVFKVRNSNSFRPAEHRQAEVRGSIAAG